VIVNFNLAGGGDFGPHIDKGGHKDHGSDEHISLSVAINAATVENRCNEVVEGSYKMNIITEDRTWNNL